MISIDILEPDATTLVAELDLAHIVDGSVQDLIEVQDSIAEVQIGLESPNRSHLLVEGRVLRWTIEGEEYHSLVDTNDQVSEVESHSKVSRQITVRGRDLAGQWGDVRVGQWPGMDHPEVRYYTRHFNAASPGKASAINDTAYEHALVLDYDEYGQPANPAQTPPVTWRDPTAHRIWSATYSGDQAVGVNLFRTTVTPTGAQVLRQHATADDRVVGWVGGVPVLRAPEYPAVIWHDTYPASTLLQDGVTYDVVYVCANEESAPGLSIAWLGAAGWLLDSPADALTPDNLAFHSDDTFGALDCTATPTPGWTPPEICSELLGEWQDLDQMAGWVVVDMAATVGVDWEEARETNFETRKTTGLDVLAQLPAEFATEVVAGVKRLLCFPPGTMGNYHTTPVSPPEVGAADLASLSFRWVTP